MKPVCDINFDYPINTFALPMIEDIAGKLAQDRMLEKYSMPAGPSSGEFLLCTDGWLLSSLGKAYFDVPSISVPGERSALSSDLSNVVDQEILWDKCVSFMKAPPDAKVEIADDSDDAFKVMAEGGEVRVVTLDRACQTLKIASMKNDEAIGAMHILFHTSPLRIEAWLTSPDGTRSAGFICAHFLKIMLDDVLGYGTRRALLHQDVASPSGDGQLSEVTEPLDGLIDFDGLWDGMIRVFRSPITNKFQRVKRFEIKPADNGVDFSVSIEAIMGFDEITLTTVFTGDKEQGFLKAEMRLGDSVHSTTMYQIHRLPLRLEVWSEVKGERVHGFTLKEIVQQSLLDRVLPWERFPHNCNFRTEAAFDSPGKCYVVDLPSCLTYDSAWMRIKRGVRHRHTGLSKQAGNVRIKQISENGDRMVFEEMLDLDIVQSRGFAHGWQEIKTTVNYTFDKDAGFIEGTRWDGTTGNELGKEHARLYSDPLRLEFWKPVDCSREAGPRLAQFLQGRLEEMLGRVAKKP